jgi:hypothetical protein
MTPAVHTAAAPPLADCRRAIEGRLARVRRRLRVQLLVEGVAWGIGTAVFLTGLSLALDRLLRPELTVRLILLALGGGLLAAIAVHRLRRPVTLRLDDLDLAELLDRRQRGIGHRLTSVLQLPQLLEQDPSASPAMIHAAVEENFTALEKVDLQATFNSARRRNAWLLLTVFVSLVVAFCAVDPATAGLWARRWFRGAKVRWPQKTYLTVTGLGDANRLQVPRGESVLFQVDSNPEFMPVDGGWLLSGRGEPLLVEGSARPASALPDNVAIRLVTSDGGQRLGAFTHYAAGQFRYELPPLTEPAEVTVTGGDDWFGPLRVEPIDRPAIESLTLVTHSPGRTEPESFRADDAEKQLLFLPTTKLELQLVATQPLASARVAISGGESAPELERQDDRRYRMTWHMKEPVTFEFHLVSRDGGLNSKPHFLTIGILNDRPPRLTLRSSGVGRRVTPVARVPLHLRVIDDFGVAELALDLEETRIVESKPVSATHHPLEEKFTAESGNKLPTDIEREPVVALSQFSLIPGATVRIRGKSADACVMGTQTAESRWLSFQVVSADELFYEILTRQREQRSRFAKALETARGQHDALQKLGAPAEAGPLVRVHQGLTRQVWQVAGQLNNTLQEMTLNELGSTTARDLLEKGIIKPMRDLHDGPLAELRSTLEGLATARSIDDERREQVLTAQSQVNDEMKRILDQMAQWESFVDVVNQLRHVISAQDQIRQTTEETQKQQIKGVFDDED